MQSNMRQRLLLALIVGLAAFQLIVCVSAANGGVVARRGPAAAGQIKPTREPIRIVRASEGYRTNISLPYIAIGVVRTGLYIPQPQIDVLSGKKFVPTDIPDWWGGIVIRASKTRVIMANQTAERCKNNLVEPGVYDMYMIFDDADFDTYLWAVRQVRVLFDFRYPWPKARPPGDMVFGTISAYNVLNSKYRLPGFDFNITFETDLYKIPNRDDLDTGCLMLAYSVDRRRLRRQLSIHSIRYQNEAKSFNYPYRYTGKHVPDMLENSISGPDVCKNEYDLGSPIVCGDWKTSPRVYWFVTKAPWESCVGGFEAYRAAAFKDYIYIPKKKPAN